MVNALKGITKTFHGGDYGFKDVFTESELLEQLKNKDKIITIIAHDLKNPLQALMLATELLLRHGSKYSKEELQSMHYDIFESVRSLRELIDNLLCWSCNLDGKTPFNPEVIDISQLVRNNLAIFKLNADTKKIVVENNIDYNSFVFADINMLDTVLRNLISNAIKFTPENGKIVLNANPNGKFVKISVSDNGYGIYKEDLDKIFCKDTCFTKQGTNGESGTGLGIMICKEFIEKNGGKLCAQSEPYVGSTFSFTVPKAGPVQ